MKSLSHRFSFSVLISIFIFFPTITGAKSVLSEPKTVSKPAVASPSTLPQDNVQRPLATPKRHVPVTTLKKPSAKSLSPAVKIRSGYCCVNGKIIKSNELNCKQQRGQFSLNKNNAKKSCDAQSGYCCKEGNLSRSKRSRCEQSGGYFSLKQTDVKRKCAATRGYCSYKTGVTTTSKATCDQKKGKFFAKKTDADAYYAQQNGFCCVAGKIIASSRGRCTQKRGSFSTVRTKIQKSCIPVKMVLNPATRVQALDGQKSIPAQNIFSQQTLTTGAKEIGQQNKLGRSQAISRNVPATGLATKTAGATGFSRAVSKQNGAGTVKETFVDQSQPRVVTGSGALRQGQVAGGEIITLHSNTPTGNTLSVIHDDGSLTTVNNVTDADYSAAFDIFGADTFLANETGYNSKGEGWTGNDFLFLLTGGDSTVESTADDGEERDPNPWNAGTVMGDDDGDTGEDKNTWNEGPVFGEDDSDDDGSDTNAWNEGTVFGDDDEEDDEEYVDLFGDVEDDDDDSDSDDSDTSEDGDESDTGSTDNKTTVADDDSDDGGDGHSVAPHTKRGTFTGGPAGDTTTFAPGEEPDNNEGAIPANFHDLGAVQILTVDGLPETNYNFEDLSEGVKETIKERGGGIRSD